MRQALHNPLPPEINQAQIDEEDEWVSFEPGAIEEADRVCPGCGRKFDPSDPSEVIDTHIDACLRKYSSLGVAMSPSSVSSSSSVRKAVAEKIHAGFESSPFSPLGGTSAQRPAVTSSFAAPPGTAPDGFGASPFVDPHAGFAASPFASPPSQQQRTPQQQQRTPQQPGGQRDDHIFC
mmetsp:Transcript_17748/g.38538  ORF Transcript_17748/g.38538 Transcript_17748/m.38538 type:complete len:178 (+) Transcript_17748:1-534(+)